MISCKDAAELLSESMERELPLRSRISLRFHVMMCRYCSRYSTQVRFIHEALGEHAERLTDAQVCQVPPLPEDRRRRIESALNSELNL